MSDHIHYGSSEYWGALRDIAVGMNDSIRVGLRVTVEGGRKHKGRIGTVTRHKRSAYEQNVFRYGSPASADLASMRGREGFVALVTPNDDGDPRPFWVPCKYLRPVSEGSGSLK